MGSWRFQVTDNAQNGGLALNWNAIENTRT